MLSDKKEETDHHCFFWKEINPNYTRINESTFENVVCERLFDPILDESLNKLNQWWIQGTFRFIGSEFKIKIFQ